MRIKETLIAAIPEQIEVQVLVAVQLQEVRLLIKIKAMGLLAGLLTQELLKLKKAAHLELQELEVLVDLEREDKQKFLVG